MDNSRLTSWFCGVELDPKSNMIQEYILYLYALFTHKANSPACDRCTGEKPKSHLSKDKNRAYKTSAMLALQVNFVGNI